MDLQYQALYGDRANTSLMGADMLNSGAASDSMDWGAILANGIRGAAQGAMAASVQGAYDSGQLQAPPGAVRGQTGSLLPLLILGGIAWAVMQ